MSSEGDFTPMHTHVLSPDTQAVLLLCGRFGKSQAADAPPLTQVEYNRTIKWLRERKLRPADLLQGDVLERLHGDIPPVSPSRLIALLERGGSLALATERWDNQGIWIVSRYDPDYPQRVAALGGQAPPILYGVGNAELLSHGGVAVVGSRDVDEEALDYTQRLARSCAKQGIQIVSGGARGVDSTAMLAAIDAGGTAVGVVPDSLSKASVSSKYREALLEQNLVLVSPYDPASGFNVGNAMGRNKYVYALADLALVVSCSEGKGGTWEGALEALERQHVFVRAADHVPQGNRRLLEKGATAFPDEPWTDIADIILRTDDYTSSTSILDLGLTQETALQEDPTPATAYGEDEVPANKATLQAPTDRNHSQTPQDQNRSLVHSGNTFGSPHSSDTIFEAVLPLLLSHLRQPRDVKSLANTLDVRSDQLKDWLNKALEQGAVLKKEKPTRYIAKCNESTLFSLETTK